MAYRRNSRALGRCTQCDEPPFARCPRCGQELCLEHLPVEGCCVDCELLFSSRRSAIHELTTLGAGLSTLLAIAVLLITDAPGHFGQGHPIPYVALLISAAACCTVAAKICGAACLKRARGAFVRRGPAHGDGALCPWSQTDHA